MGRTRVRRTKAALAALVLLALVVGFLAGRAAAGGARPAVAPRSPGGVSPGAAAGARPRFHVVRPGDTLWSIASRVAGPGADPRPVVDRLARLNRVADGVIVPGQRLALP
jgi:nucleoid-associated protein YgaU